MGGSRSAGARTSASIRCPGDERTGREVERLPCEARADRHGRRPGVDDEGRKTAAGVRAAGEGVVRDITHPIRVQWRSNRSRCCSGWRWRYRTGQRTRRSRRNPCSRTGHDDLPRGAIQDLVEIGGADDTARSAGAVALHERAVRIVTDGTPGRVELEIGVASLGPGRPCVDGEPRLLVPQAHVATTAANRAISIAMRRESMKKVYHSLRNGCRGGDRSTLRSALDFSTGLARRTPRGANERPP